MGIEHDFHRLFVTTSLWRANEPWEKFMPFCCTVPFLRCSVAAPFLCCDLLPCRLEFGLQAPTIKIWTCNPAVHAIAQHHAVFRKMPHRELGVFSGICQLPQQLGTFGPANESVQITTHQPIFHGQTIGAHVPGILRGIQAPQESTVIQHLLMGIENYPFQATCRKRS